MLRREFRNGGSSVRISITTHFGGTAAAQPEMSPEEISLMPMAENLTMIWQKNSRIRLEYNI